MDIQKFEKDLFVVLDEPLSFRKEIQDQMNQVAGIVRSGTIFKKG